MAIFSLFRNPAKEFFSQEEGNQIIAAIREAELQTSGELRVHVEYKSRRHPLDRAARIFQKLKMDETEERNGVLIYLAIKDHQFAIVADKGINQKVPEDFWVKIKDEMQSHFKDGDFVNGLGSGIAKIGIELQAYFPRKDDDINELPDEISYS